MKANPIEEENEDPKLYEDLKDFENVGKKFEMLLKDYNESENNKEM